METCENCGETIGNLETPMVWKEAVVCGQCYEKLAPRGAVATMEATPDSSARSCPSCGSHDVQKASVIYEQGSSSGIGGAIFGNEIGVTSMSSRTALASRWAPPTEPSFYVSRVVQNIGGVIAGICVLLLIVAVVDAVTPHNVYEERMGWGWPFAGVLVGVAMLAAGFSGRAARAAAAEEAKKQRTLWAKTWVCLRCGNGFRE